mmetsp:Transcript_15498/g.29244  ORF Transcript_15498/g.29244 Transcript_15498/m.29244 type:complete len:1113 (-) Transcript_15498:42-3380(-)|eukprot:CAMPEP_0176476778 /NCGR_PEP_ID=MMETSP0200_2-20121128/243_1 /TAXON_ID=947934 /ORGANISM="Chaetoceros sp., Strain GSL56" /LENGTH=1112 /DNA_ID=CAMNT_0017872489 /DNA_START=134 /DNA_END=3472 /DNA_ORIENTATION=+
MAEPANSTTKTSGTNCHKTSSEDSIDSMNDQHSLACQDIISPPRQHLSSLACKKLQLETIGETLPEDNSNNEEMESIAMTPQRRVHYEKFATPTNNRNVFHRGQSQPIKYYRIVYRGVVALLSQPDAESKKSGAYVSYGEIIASTQEIEITQVDYSSPKKQKQEVVNHQPYVGSVHSSPRSSTSRKTTSSSLPLAPSSSFVDHHHSPLHTQQQDQHEQILGQTFQKTIQKIIQVDEVLTGGFAIDASVTATSYTHCTPRRSNAKNNGSQSQPNTTSSDSPNFPSPPKLLKNGQGNNSQQGILQSNKATSHKRHHGYLLQSRKGMLIAERIPSPPLLCQTGTFYYRVTSKTPLPILAGPCADAPVTRAMAFPGTVHEISVRMGSLDHTASYGNGLEDGIVYLRLAHRRGWIADRRYVVGKVLLERGKEKSESSPPRHKEVVKLEVVMREVTDYVDISAFSISDDVSLGGTSISSSSICTPASVIRTRRRSTRRRDTEDCMSGMVVQSKSKTNQKVDMNVSTTIDLSNKKNEQQDDADLSTIRGCKSDDAELHNMDILSQNMGHARVKPTVYLMRVTAVTGLKILDAPHFQVNSLIRRQSHGTTQQQNVSGKQRNQLTKTVPNNKNNPSSIFHTMKASAYSNSTVNTTNNTSWTFDASGKYRFLPRGALFEASRRIEKATNFTPGSGLIKLADNTGWAIVPNQEELREKYELHRANVGIGITEEETLMAYEEVGNAVVSGDKTSRRDYDNVFWVRVVQQTGVLVSCSPPDPETNEKFDASSCKLGAPIGSNFHSKEQDPEVSSTISGAFFEAFRSTRKSDEAARLDSLSVNGRLPRNSNGLVIPCGSCVKVTPWLPSSTLPEKQSFVQLHGGQGWIPRIIHGAHYSVDIKRPEVRHGSFWFRVQPASGVRVRIGPSSRAPAIKSDHGYFQFECGEFLRASEVLTIHGHADIDDSEDVAHPSESFARLYRRRDGDKNIESNFGCLPALTMPCEWVHVHCNGYLYLEECVHPPFIERHPEGWRFEVTYETGVSIRVGPSFDAAETGRFLQNCAIVVVNEKVTADGESLTWLRLKDGRGWIHNLSKDGECVLTLCAARGKKSIDHSVTKLISRLGLR